jgi:vitamin B12 transporter
VQPLRSLCAGIPDQGLGLLTLFLVLAGLTAAVPGAMAQPPGPEKSKVEEPKVEEAPAPTPQFFETTNVVARPVSSSAGSVSIVEGAEVERTAARSLSEALRSVPGLGLISSSGRAGTTQAYIRGGDPNFGLVLLDGIPLNDSTDRQGGAVNFEELPALLLERVEVVRGPLTSYYGPSSLAGVVQLFTARGGPGPTRVSVGAEAGNAELRHAFGRVLGSTPRGGYSGGASWDQERGRVGNDRFLALDLWGTWDHDLGGDKHLAVSSRFSSGEADDYPDASGGPVYGTGELRHTERQDLALGTRLEWGDPGKRRHRAIVAVSRRTLDRTSPEVPPLVPASVEETAYTRLRGGWEVPLLRKPRIALDAGLSGEAEWADNVSLLRLPPDLGGDTAGDYEGRRATGGVFGGVRHERGPLLLEASLRLDAATGDSLQVNPQIGVVWRLDASGDTRLRATGGRASKLPSFFGLSSPRALGGNPDLRPERTLGGEVGAEQSFGSGRLVLGAAFFVQEYRDLVDFDFDLFQSVNRRRVRAKGTELTLRSHLAATLSLDLEATWLQAEAGSNEPLLHRPRWQGGGRLRFEPGTRLSLVLEGRASSASLDRQIPTPDLDHVSGYAVWGFAGSFRVGNRWTIRTRLDNLTDRGYETYIGFPGPRRGFWLGLSWQRT